MTKILPAAPISPNGDALAPALIWINVHSAVGERWLSYAVKKGGRNIERPNSLPDGPAKVPTPCKSDPRRRSSH